MPRKKKTGPVHPNRSSNRATPRGSRLQPDFVPFAATQPNGRSLAFSLQQEARNTSGHRDWEGRSLRNAPPVNFVSAGCNHPSAIDLDAQRNIENETSIRKEPDKYEEASEAPETKLSGATHPAPPFEPDTGFIVDTMGTGPINTGLPAPIIRSVSPTLTDSSEEVIVFKGRFNMGKDTAQGRNGESTDTLDRKIRIVEDKIHEREELLESIHTHEAISEHHLTSRPADLSKLRPRVSPGKFSRPAVKEHEDALLADYIANMEAEESDNIDTSVFKNRELGGSDVEVWLTESNEASSRETDSKKPAGRKLTNPRTRSNYSWDRENIADLNDLPTSDEAFGSIQEILSSRDRATGTQYLVVWDDHTTDECRWVSASTLLDTPGAAAMIQSFEEEEKLVAEFQNNGISDEDSDDDSDDDGNEDQSESESIDNDMTDEQLARLLAKQEELGMGSERLMLFDAAGVDEDETNYIIRDVSMPYRKGAKRPRGEFPAASALADAYDGFDIMDRERPSLQKRKKGKKAKGPPNLDLSDLDDDLAVELQLQYEKDRNKKKAVKQEREELRAQGLLGKGKNGKPDMKAKYKEGITLGEIKEEIKNFLFSDSPQLGLPPMEKAQRKLVHEVAAAFNLKSSSYGSGQKRFPMLIRTNRTTNYNEYLFKRFEERLGRRFLPRPNAGRKYGGAPKPAGVGRGGGSNNAAVSYRDGEVVGGSAPELGVENKGRAMLEKMGWSQGDALGALNNKGILQPVSHVVKTTKAGLG